MSITDLESFFARAEAPAVASADLMTRGAVTGTVGSLHDDHCEGIVAGRDFLSLSSTTMADDTAPPNDATTAMPSSAPSTETPSTNLPEDDPMMGTAATCFLPVPPSRRPWRAVENLGVVHDGGCKTCQDYDLHAQDDREDADSPFWAQLAAFHEPELAPLRRELAEAHRKIEDLRAENEVMKKDLKRIRHQREDLQSSLQNMRGYQSLADRLRNFIAAEPLLMPPPTTEAPSSSKKRALELTSAFEPFSLDTPDEAQPAPVASSSHHPGEYRPQAYGRPSKRPRSTHQPRPTDHAPATPFTEYAPLPRPHEADSLRLVNDEDVAMLSGTASSSKPRQWLSYNPFAHEDESEDDERYPPPGRDDQYTRFHHGFAIRAIHKNVSGTYWIRHPGAYLPHQAFQKATFPLTLEQVREIEAQQDVPEKLRDMLASYDAPDNDILSEGNKRDPHVSYKRVQNGPFWPETERDLQELLARAKADPEDGFWRARWNFWFFEFYYGRMEYSLRSFFDWKEPLPMHPRVPDDSKHFKPEWLFEHALWWFAKVPTDQQMPPGIVRVGGRIPFWERLLQFLRVRPLFNAHLKRKTSVEVWEAYGTLYNALVDTSAFPVTASAPFKAKPYPYGHPDVSLLRKHLIECNCTGQDATELLKYARGFGKRS